MCSITAGIIGLQTAMGMASARQQAKQQQQYYENQAKVADQNAAIAKNQASQKADQYAQKQKQISNQWRVAAGQRNAAMGSAGLAGGVGSGLDLTSASNTAFKQDSLNLLNNQHNDTWNSYVQQVNYENAAKNNRYYGEQAKAQGNMQMFMTALDGIGSIYGGLNKGSSNSSGGWGGIKSGSRKVTDKGTGFLNSIGG